MWGAVTMLAYFASLFAAFGVVVSDLRRVKHTRTSTVLYCASAAAFCGTWYFILSWLRDDMAAYESFSVWVRDSDLFVQAYRMVALTPGHWYLSCQLLTYVVPWVLFAAVHEAIPTPAKLAYIWLGFAGAISLSLPLLLVRCGEAGFSLAGLPASNEGSSVTLWALLAVSVGSILALPMTLETELFGYSLAALHVGLLLIPVAAARGVSRRFASVALWALALACGVVNLKNRWDAGSQDFVAVALSHYCQASITLDLFFVTVVSCASLCYSSVVGARGAPPATTTVALIALMCGVAFCPATVLAVWIALSLGKAE